MDSMAHCDRSNNKRKAESTLTDYEDINIDHQEDDNVKKLKIEPSTAAINSNGGGDDHLDDDLEEFEFTQRTVKFNIETEGSIHDVVVPVDMEYVPLKDLNSNAKQYSFALDSFQREAIQCIENNQSVLVSAHTSAGKTAVAEYAIALALMNKQRIIYTTPIKALSNQKYRQFQVEFENVGLITGDVNTNSNASCLIMTTEILRMMLFCSSEIMSEVGWVIFDEVHYMRDPERGVIWEETIILLPDTVRYVFLSATLPNAVQFAEWIVHLHHQACHVVCSDYRPVPLEHWIYPTAGHRVHLVLDAENNFCEENFDIAMRTFQKESDDSSSQEEEEDRAMNRRNRKKRRKRKGYDVKSCKSIVRSVMEREWAPVIIFSFGRMEVEAYATAFENEDYNSDIEKTLVEEVFSNAIDMLSEQDQQLPQIQAILPLLKRGIGMHHSGLLPLIKETTEILFSEGLIKALFATETFAMGLNMPARTVIFTSARKFDGANFRWLTSGEYIQMSGRAGRRGLDKLGYVILMIDEKMSPDVGKELVCGAPNPINSAFYLTYNMMLNLMRVNDINPEFMLQHSFFQFQHYQQYPHLCMEYNMMKEELEGISDYIDTNNLLVKSQQELQAFIKPQNFLPFLSTGRLVKLVSDEGIDLDWGVLVENVKKDQNDQYSIKVLLPLESDPDSSAHPYLPPSSNDKVNVQIVTFNFDNITLISAVRMYLPTDAQSLPFRQPILKTIHQIKDQYPNGIPLLSPMDVMASSIEKHKKRLVELDGNTPNNELYQQKLEWKQILEAQMADLKLQMKKTRQLLQMDELKRRKAVLHKLGYFTEDEVIGIKGRVACEISSGDELLLTEMLFEGVFHELNVKQIAAILSCFLFEEKTRRHPILNEELTGPLKRLRNIAKHIVAVSQECQLNIDETGYLRKFKPNLMEVVYNWADGKSFECICEMTDAFEGSIIRCLRRMEDLLRQLCQAAKVIDNTDLEVKFTQTIKLIKRDIVFAASLYL